MGIAIDVGIGIIVLIAAIVGVIRGFHNQFTKGFCNFVALCAGIALTALVAPLFRPMDFYQGLQTTAAGWFSADYFSVTVNSAEELKTALADTPLKILSGMADQIFNSMQTSGAATLGRLFGNAIINIISAFLVWLVFYLIIKFALFGLRQLMTKLSGLPVLKSIDKIFGLIWAEILTYLVVVVLVLTTFEIVVSSFVPSWIEPVKNAIAASKLLSFAHSFNLGSVLAKFIGIDLTVFSPI